jgi:hypothetical protein
LEDHGLRPAQGRSSQDPISEIARAKWTGYVTQAVEYLLCKPEALSLKPTPIPSPSKKPNQTTTKNPQTKNSVAGVGFRYSRKYLRKPLS